MFVIILTSNMDRYNQKATADMQYRDFSRDISRFILNRIFAAIALAFIVAASGFLLISYWLITGSEYVEEIMEPFGFNINNYKDIQNNVQLFIKNIRAYLKETFQSYFATSNNNVTIKEEDDDEDEDDNSLYVSDDDSDYEDEDDDEDDDQDDDEDDDQDDEIKEKGITYISDDEVEDVTDQVNAVRNEQLINDIVDLTETDTQSLGDNDTDSNSDKND